MQAPDVLVLCYHGISRSWPAATTVAPERFASQMRRLVARGYQGATLTDALTAPPAGRTLVVTFDDAHRSVLELAQPIMAKLDLPGTVFAPTDYIDRHQLMAWDGYDRWEGTEHEGELAPMSWDELRGLTQIGWEVGSHTKSHPRLSRVDDDRLATELEGSRAVCEQRLGVPCRSFAYPYSDFDDRVVRAVREAGYALAVTVPRATASPLPLKWPRVGVYRDDSLLRVRARIFRRGRLPRRRRPRFDAEPS